MKKSLFILITVWLCCWSQVDAQNIIVTEYFIDTDPGIGAGIKVDINASSTINDLMFSIGLSTLSAGTHQLFFRVKDSNGVWSTTERVPFYTFILSSLPPATNITNAEYFIDTDPGVGSGTIFSITPGLSISNMAIPIPVNSLPDGDHTLFIRIKNANGTWSVSQPGNFSVNNTSAGNPTLTIEQGDLTIPNNGSYDFGNVFMKSNSGDLTFLVRNTGDAPLNINLPGSTLTGPGASDFTLDLTGLPPSIMAGSSYPVKIRFTPIKAGDRTAQISIASNDPVQNPFVVNLKGTGVKLEQTISFEAMPDRTLGDPDFNLTATSSSELPVSYSSMSDKISIDGGKVKMMLAGRAMITAIQAGNENFNEADPVSGTFCIKPVKPTISLAGANTDAPLLSSSASGGSQWYRNGEAIAGATGQTFHVSQPGIYKVRISADDCLSEFSNDFIIIITGDLELPAILPIVVSPNPVNDLLEISGLPGRIDSYQLYDMKGLGVSLDLQKVGDRYQGHVAHLAQGLYMLRFREGQKLFQTRFIKQ